MWSTVRNFANYLSYVFQMWLNTMIQTFYICENNSNSNYPTTGKYCTAFANEFYKLISGIIILLQLQLLLNFIFKQPEIIMK
jgi:hypothetical protein